MNPDRSLQASCSPFPTPLNTLLEISRVVPWVKGAALAIRREAFEAVSGFDTSFFMYTEEVDLCYRLNEAGWETHFAPVTTVVHIGGGGTVQVRAAVKVELFASIMRFYARHSTRRNLAEVFLIIKSFFSLRTSQLGSACCSRTRRGRDPRLESSGAERSRG